MVTSDFNGVTANVVSEDFTIRGFDDGTVIVFTENQEVRFQRRVNGHSITSIVVIDETVRFIRIASTDITGRLVVFSITWKSRDCEDDNFTVDFEYACNHHVCQLANCYPKHACLCLVTNFGTLLSVNWRTSEVRRMSLFTKDIKESDFGLVFNRRSDLIYISLLTKVGLKLFIIDFMGMSLLHMCTIDKLPCLDSKRWTKMLWYCDRFVLCYGSNFLAIFDPIAYCTLRVVEMQLDDEILFVTSKYADVSVAISKPSGFEVRMQHFSGKELLFVKVVEPLPIEVPEFVEPDVKEDIIEELPAPKIPEQTEAPPTANRDSMPEQSAIPPEVKRDSAVSASTHSNESLLALELSNCYPKLTEWVERAPASVPRVLLGQYASDSNIPATQGPEFSGQNTETSSSEREHASSFSQQPQNAEGVENARRRDSSGAQSSIRPAVSADDRLMKLFFPADYNKECPFPSQPARSNEHVNLEGEEGDIIENASLSEATIEVPSINFLDFWPIWLDMPLAWTSSLTSSGPAAAFFGALRPTSVSLSKHHIYVTDSANRLWYASLDCKTVRWQAAADASPCDQVSTSPQGDILWLLRSGSVFAAQMVSTSAPCGTRWERILLDVSYIHVTEGRAFYIRRDGALMMQSGLSSRRPSYVSIQLHTPFRLKSVVVAGLDVWGQCADGRVAFNSRLLANSGTPAKSHTQVSRRDEAFTGEWHVDKHCPPDASRVTSIFTGPFCTVMVADELCRIWIRRSSTSPFICLADYLIPISKAKCPDDWWLIPLPRNPDESAESSNFQKTWPLYAAACQDTVVITAPSMGSGALQLYLNKGHLLGQHLRRIRPNGSALTTRWRSVHFVEPSQFHDPETKKDGEPRRERSASKTGRNYQSFAWLVGETGELLRLDFATLNAISPSPMQLRASNVKIVSLGQHVTWVLLQDGHIWACHHGLEADRWAQLDLAQLSEEYLPVIDIAVGPRLVWILTANGSLFFRIGTTIFATNTVSQPALCRLTDDATSGVPDVPLRRIYASPSNDWMVFALPAAGSISPRPILRSGSKQSDSYNLAPLARMGVTADVPIGCLWHPVIGGPPMADLAISAAAGLFGIPDSTAHDQKAGSRSAPSSTPQTGSTVYWRAGVRQQDPTGTYWRRVIDGVTHVSVGDSHAQLCLVGSDGSMYVHAVCCLANGLGQQDDSQPHIHRSSVTEQPTEKELGGWEMI